MVLADPPFVFGRTFFRHSFWKSSLTCIPHCLGFPCWHYQLVLSWYLHQPEAHQLSLQKATQSVRDIRIPNQALTGTRYPTLPGLFFYYPYPTRFFVENFRVQGSNYTCCFQSRITSMMPADQIQRERNSLKKVKTFISPPYLVQKYASDK